MDLIATSHLKINIEEQTTYQDLFHQCLALEFEHPSAFGAVHHLTVICYYPQHYLYSPQGWLESRRLLARFMLESASPAEVRRQKAPRLPSGEKLPGLEALSWARSIASLHLDSPQTYCER